MVEPESHNDLVEPFNYGGGRIRTSGGYPRGSTSGDAEHFAVSPSSPPLKIVVLSPEEARQREAVERVSAASLSPDACLRLVGLTEGEGCFYLARMNKGNWRCGFVIKLRADDRPLLEKIQATIGIGKLRKEDGPSRVNPCVRWEVTRKDECELLRAIFTAYPLESKKARDATIWMEALDEWALIYQNEKADWTRMEELDREMRAVRKFPALAEETTGA